MSKTILLADDSVTIRKVVELTFMDEAYELVSVGSGSEAIERLDSGVDLVIADVHMPGADGYEVCKASKSEAPERPVMLLVGTFESYDESKAAAAGADDHLKKPFDSQDLLTRVRELLRESGPTTELELEAFTEAEVEPPVVEETRAATSVEEGSTEFGRESLRSVVPDAEAEASPSDGGEAEVAATSEAATVPGESPLELSDETVDRIARRVVELLSEEAIRDVAWEVIPDLAEVVIKERLHDLESQVE